MRISPILPLLIAITAMLSACAHNVDSVARLNDVPMGSANQTNIAAMLVHPSDLLLGRHDGRIDGASAVAPVERLQTDHEKPLLSIGHTSSGGGAGG